MKAALVRWAGRLARWVPDPVLGQVLPKRLRYRTADLPPLPLPADVPIRLYIAPVNWAGQGWQWARAAERNIDGVSAVTMAYHLGSEFNFPVDQRVPVAAYVASARWQRRQRDAVLSRFTHVLVEAERHPLGGTFRESVVHQVRSLTDAGLRVAMLAHGTDIRLPSRHARNNVDSPFRAGLAPRASAMERDVENNLATLRELGLPVFVSTPDLLLDVVTARWLPVVVDPLAWRSSRQVLAEHVPVVVHAPSQGGVKGSELIDPVLTALHDSGVIEYRRARGLAAREMPAFIGAADIVVDQFRIGDYGVASCEAMAAGRIVIANLSEHSRATAEAAASRPLPIVQSTAAELGMVIKGIIADRAHFRDSAASGPAFVAAVHDGRFSAGVLRGFLDAGGAT